MRARGEGVSFRDVKIKIPDRNVTWGYEWRHAPEACAEDFGGFEKSQLSFASEEDGWLSLACRGLVAGATHGLGEMEKSV